MKVLKFGGSSVGSVDGILNLKNIVESRGENTVVVVSALGGVTDQLLALAQSASSCESDYLRIFDEMVQRHITLIESVVPSAKVEEVKVQVGSLFEELGNLLRGVCLIRDLSPKTNNTIVSYGERLSSLIVSSVIEGAALMDARKFIKTRAYYGKHVVDFELTERLIDEQFIARPKVVVVPGFISEDRETSETTNLGRGGSDYTAAILAATLKADMLEIWTDVDGFMTADPRVISNAYVIEQLSFIEAMELCNFGAKVIYPPTIFPAYHKNIPIIIKNTYHPEAKGTLIAGHKNESSSPINLNKAIKGISSINDTCLITIQGLGMVGVIGVNYRIFKALSKAGVSVFFVSQASSENTTSIGVSNGSAELAHHVLSEEFEQEIKMGEINKIRVENNLATVAIVGDKMKHTPGIAGKLFGTLGRNGINVIACAQGASETNISFVVKLDSLKKTLSVIHDSFFLSEYQVINLFLAGVGVVGHNLLEQIRQQQDILLKNNSLQLKVIGISNSKRCIFNRSGIDLSTYKEQLAVSATESSPEILRDSVIEMNLFNSVFVDCTASAGIPTIYADLLDHNISVVAANKVAASADYCTYQELKQTARRRGVKFLFETNVGAGLPIINTINALINSGDKILKIEAVVSGTLNFIFNKLGETVPLSQTIAMAKEAGYSEPDPRIDLSGMDVIRKIVILSREAGYTINIDDVDKQLFVPESYFEGSLDDFWKNISGLDAEFEARRKVVADAGKRWRFVAQLNEGQASVGLQEVDEQHPFFHLEGSNNVILLTTERYKEYPMQIKGYGAGASVTAAGVFADIISIANIR